MKKILLFLIPLFLAIIALSVFVFFINKGSGKGALQVTAIPKSNVYLDGNLIGQTPLCKCEVNEMIEEGEHSIKVAPMEGSFTAFDNKITIEKSVLTVVDRTFGEGAMSEGSIITLSPIDDKKTAQLLILSYPDKADVILDSNTLGKTPLFLKSLTSSDHTLKLGKDGYKDKVIRIRAVNGYKLSTSAFLAISPTLDISPSPAASASPTPSAAKVIILQTPTGFLRVREEPSISSPEVSRVSPGETFEVLEESGEWFKIKLENNSGWISNQYAQKEII